MTDRPALEAVGEVLAPKYVVDPMSKFPKRWHDHIGPLRVMGEPIEGYVMVRRPGSMPFCLPVSTILNATKDRTHGPFTLVTKGKSTSIVNAGEER